MKLLCPFCGKTAGRAPFHGSFTQDNEDAEVHSARVIGSGGAYLAFEYGEEGAECEDGYVQKFVCSVDKDHVFYPSFEAESVRPLQTACMAKSCTKPFAALVTVKGADKEVDIFLCPDDIEVLKTKITP